jgi:nitrite reductase/ring-hydroxylating ferredoxin subunit
MSAVSEGFVVVGKTSDLAPGEMKFVAVDRERVVLANVDGALYALGICADTETRRCRAASLSVA